MVLVQKNKKLGFANATTKQIIVPAKYDFAESYSEGLALVGVYDRSRGDTISYYDSQMDKDVVDIRFAINYDFIDKTGKTVLKFYEHSEVHSFSEGLAAVGVKTRPKNYAGREKVTIFGFVNQKGEFKIPYQYTNVGDVHQGLFSFRNDDKHGFINLRGDTVVQPVYAVARPFSCGWSLVLRDNGQYNYIDKQGKLLLADDAWDASEFSENRAFIRTDYTAKWQILIDEKGETIKQVPFQFHSDFHSGYCAVWNRPDFFTTDKLGAYLTPDGNISELGNFDEVNDFVNGCAKVSNEKVIYYINEQGK
jgi:hypothetical protein